MKNKENNESTYTWNDYVIIKNNAPKQYPSGKIGIVCGMSKIEFEEIADKYCSRLGDWIYTVEFEDGSDIQIAEIYLELYEV